MAPALPPLSQASNAPRTWRLHASTQLIRMPGSQSTSEGSCRHCGRSLPRPHHFLPPAAAESVLEGTCGWPRQCRAWLCRRSGALQWWK
eukprot:12890749-Prorocentrum_lima.AAC.1